LTSHLKKANLKRLSCNCSVAAKLFLMPRLSLSYASCSKGLEMILFKLSVKNNFSNQIPSFI